MTPVDELLELLDLEVIEHNLFRGAQPPGPAGPRGRVFGGQVASQALRAAHATVDAEHHVHSLHSYFLRPGRSEMPTVYQVDRIRDGRSFTTRRVVAIQDGEAIFNLDASFHREEAGLIHQVAAPEDVPVPDELSRRTHRHRHHRVIDERDVPDPVPIGGRGVVTRQMWLRVEGELPDDPDLHACVIAYVSDTGPVGAARRAHEDERGDVAFMTASLDHSMWFHRPVRADRWLLYTLEAVSTSNARGLVWGTLHTSEGELAVTIAQEALLRPVG